MDELIQKYVDLLIEAEETRISNTYAGLLANFAQEVLDKVEVLSYEIGVPKK